MLNTEVALYRQIHIQVELFASTVDYTRATCIYFRAMCIGLDNTRSTALDKIQGTRHVVDIYYMWSKVCLITRALV